MEKKGRHKFPKGQSGNPTGRKKGQVNKITAAAKEFYQNILDDPAYRKSARRRLIAGKAPHLERWLAERFIGKPKEHLEISTTTPLFVLREAPSVLPFVPTGLTCSDEPEGLPPISEYPE